MFIQGDQLVLLREDRDCIWASCEGVVGWVKKGEIQFDQIASSSSPSPRSSLEIIRDDLPRTVLTAPSPPPIVATLPETEGDGLDAPSVVSRRISGPFELESPQQSPNLDQGERFFDRPHERDTQDKPVSRDPREEQEESQEKRESVASIASSEALGGIGGFMMGDSASEGEDSDGMEELQG